MCFAAKYIQLWIRIEHSKQIGCTIGCSLGCLTRTEKCKYAWLHRCSLILGIPADMYVFCLERSLLLLLFRHLLQWLSVVPFVSSLSHLSRYASLCVKTFHLTSDANLPDESICFPILVIFLLGLGLGLDSPQARKVSYVFFFLSGG